jgi:ribonuclease M5
LIRINEVLVVEGRYDKNKLSQFLDATIVTTEGFGVFNDHQKLELLRRLAEKRGLVILTDSDGAGFLIRSRLKSVLDSGRVKHAYIPDVFGKERRKASPGKEGKLGVEGMTRETILSALKAAGVSLDEAGSNAPRGSLTKADMFELGLSGGADSAARRAALKRKLELPEKLSANALLEVLNALVTREELEELCQV